MVDATGHLERWKNQKAVHRLRTCCPNDRQIKNQQRSRASGPGSDKPSEKPSNLQSPGSLHLDLRLCSEPTLELEASTSTALLEFVGFRVCWELAAAVSIRPVLAHCGLCFGVQDLRAIAVVRACLRTWSSDFADFLGQVATPCRASPNAKLKARTNASSATIHGE